LLRRAYDFTPAEKPPLAASNVARAEQPSAVSHIILRRARQFTRVERPGRNDLTRQMRRRSLDCCSRPSQRNAKVKIFLAQADNDLSLTFLDPLLGIFLVGL
jgi:hypothetical protein